MLLKMYIFCHFHQKGTVFAISIKKVHFLPFQILRKAKTRVISQEIPKPRVLKPLTW